MCLLFGCWSCLDWGLLVLGGGVGLLDVCVLFIDFVWYVCCGWWG